MIDVSWRPYRLDMAEILWEAPLDSPTEAPLPCAHKGLPCADKFVGLEFWPMKATQTRHTYLHSCLMLFPKTIQEFKKHALSSQLRLHPTHSQAARGAHHLVIPCLHLLPHLP